jgi:hypothetical protein
MVTPLSETVLYPGLIRDFGAGRRPNAARRAFAAWKLRLRRNRGITNYVYSLEAP